ncbi:decarboxylating 6-phosphogluconate dehydrogenase [Lactiplantibacillus garii]|uniref:Decarboxylating 6-phosphogluconate dehydrogenase n=1 Tax=Lactiplantibacillus garii TaxID=2306423 RepID=A0A426D3R1_9LACO|nr:decarboxylating 6-phosphogluconate dehydrogenase [Lactiplantibacillus garii]RRK09208.1 decarboxylating 6-phosphogluconate dehydrogenase [Lactiplantibacillus garii]
MKIGLIGLGKMGLNLALNLADNGITPIGFDINEQNVDIAKQANIVTADNLALMISKLPSPKIIWIMVPAGKPTDSVVNELKTVLTSGDIVIDGGNSFYKDSIQRAMVLEEKGITFFDVGTSGGQAGARHNGNFMIGGNPSKFKIIEPIFIAISALNGYLYTGPSGSGHYLKMVHNGIEYGMMESIGEGFDVLQHSPYDYNNVDVARMWNSGSVIRSWLMELAEQAFSDDGNLEDIKGTMHSSGEGRWTLDEALDQQVATPVIAMSLLMRYRSMEQDTFSGKVVSALRNEFGGHEVDKK